jgi:putative transposase
MLVFCHVVFIPKYRRKTLYGELRQHLGEVFRRLAMQKESRVEEGHLMPDHVHMIILIPAEIRGLASDRLRQEQERDPFGPCLRGAEAQFHRPALWARGYFVSTVGRDEAVIREYIRKQEAEDSRLDQLNMWR